MPTAYVRPQLPFLADPWKWSDASDPTFTVNAIVGEAITINVILYQNRQKPVGVYSGAPVSISVYLQYYLSTDAAGQDILAAGSEASGGIAAGTNGTLLQTIAGISGFCVPNLANGEIDIVVTDGSARNLYLNIVLPSGAVITSPVLTF